MATILSAHDKSEEIIYRGERHFLCGTEESGFCLLKAHWLDAAVPQESVCREYRLAEAYGNGNTQKAVGVAFVELPHIVERGAEAYFAAGERYVLINRQFSPGVETMCTHKAIFTGLVHIRCIAVGVRRQSARERDFGESVGAVASPLPVCGFEFVEGHGGIYAFHPGHGYGVVERKQELARRSFGGEQRHEHYQYEKLVH